MGRAIWACGVLLAAQANLAVDVAAAEAMNPPRIVSQSIDWEAARADFSLVPALEDIPAAHDAGQSDVAFARVNAAVGRRFPGIGGSAVPVLIPYDPDAALRTAALQAVAPPEQGAETAARGGFSASFFHAGATGYDAAFLAPPDLVASLSGRARKDEVLVHISGFSIRYDLPDRPAPKRAAVKELEASFPGVQRSWHENYVRYSFARYGALYVVSMLCVDGRPRGRWIACKDADRIIARFFDSLRLAGGAPQLPLAGPVDPIDRPSVQSAEFTFAPPGEILSNTGFRKLGGHPDRTVYALIRFPIGQAPAFANSQSFLNWGNCDFTGRTSAPSRKGAPYRCKVNDKPLVFDESAPENRMYPWRDNFCEHRHFFVGQCPGGQGHQGQDIRPATCQLRNEGADRCNAYLDDVVAVRDGAIMRTAGRETMFLVANAPGERVRFRYLHMHPKKLDADGLVSGRKVREGEVLGKVGNFDRHDNGTTYHLHFDMQVPTELGWVFVNPYMTLVASYERLIGGRGREIGADTMVAQPDSGTPEPSSEGNAAASATSASGDHVTAGPVDTTAARADERTDSRVQP